MSLLTNFANTAFSAASSVIGVNTLSIAGGSGISCVQQEIRHARAFEDGGFAPESAFDLVCRKSVFAAAYTSAANSYIGNTATFGGVTYRVGEILDGRSTVTIRLEHQQVST